MKDGRRAAEFALVLWMLPVACEQPAVGSGGAPLAVSGTATAPAVGEKKPRLAGSAVAPRHEAPLLAPDQRRVLLLVVPGDAQVEVDGRPVRRRNGVIELVGKVGEVRRVRARKDDKSTEEKVVTIKETGASPPLINLNEPLPAAAGKVKVKRKAFDVD
jgi:hypothetical protein